MVEAINTSSEAFVSPFARRRRQLEAVLDELFPMTDGTTRTLIGPGIPAGGSASMHVRVDEAWLVLDLALAAAQTPPLSWWQIVELQASLPACAKIVLSHNEADRPSQLYLRADVALDAEGDLASRVAAVGKALPVALIACASAGLTTQHGPRPMPANDTAQPVQNSSDNDASVEAAKLVAEAGWEYIERSPAEGVVDLMVPGEFRQAELTACAGGLRLAAYLSQASAPEIATESIDDADTSEALAGFLLRAGGWVRAVRPALGVPIDANPDSTSPQPCFEFVVAPPVSADHVGRGLAALAVAARWCLAEAEILQRNPSLAAAYLRAAGTESREQIQST